MAETKILYAIQATGNGHVARAKEILPHLQQHGSVDVLLSGTQADLGLGVAPTYCLDGIGFAFGRNGGFDVGRTFREHVFPQLKLRALREFLRIPVHEYSLVLNDFEPISAWRAKLGGVPSAQISHQAAFQSEKTPRPDVRCGFAEFVMRYFAVSDRYVGLHYQAYDTDVHTPIIRSAVRRLEPRNDGHVTVYHPAYSAERMIPVLQRMPGTEWHVFDKHGKDRYVSRNVRVSPVNEPEFLASLESCAGLITAGGFQATSEAIFLKKRLLVMPMRGQYEQHCNAAALKAFGVPALQSFGEQAVGAITDWLEYSKPLEVNFPDETAALVADIAERAITRRQVLQFVPLPDAVSVDEPPDRPRAAA